MRWQFWLIFLPIAVVVVALSVANREPVPFGIGFGLAWQVPLFLLLLAAGFLGILCGGFGAWLAAGRSRRRARAARAEAAAARTELEGLRREVEALRADPSRPPAATPPALAAGAGAAAAPGAPPGALPATSAEADARRAGAA